MDDKHGPWGSDTEAAANAPPVVTIALVIVMVMAYLLEVALANASLKPDIGTLIQLGALDKALVINDGQWWRLFTAPLLHGGLDHILFNCIALVLISPRLERLIGSGWYAADFVVSSLAGGLLSLLINPNTLVSVGASGGIMGLFMTAVVASFHLPQGSDQRTRLQTDAARVLVPTLIPALFIPLSGGSQNGIDVAAHLGGAIGGILVGLVRIRQWSSPSD